MIAAAAWRSGTSAPVASVLKRGMGVSRTIRTRAATLARDSFVVRAFEACGEYAGFATVFFVDFEATVPRRLLTVEPATAELASNPNERQTATTVAAGPKGLQLSVISSFCRRGGAQCQDCNRLGGKRNPFLLHIGHSPELV